MTLYAIRKSVSAESKTCITKYKFIQKVPHTNTDMVFNDTDVIDIYFDI